VTTFFRIKGELFSKTTNKTDLRQIFQDLGENTNAPGLKTILGTEVGAQSNNFKAQAKIS